MDRDADEARLIGDGAGHRLPDPPQGVSGKLEAAAMVEFFHGFHQPDVSLLDEVGQGDAAVGVFLGHGDDQAQVGCGHSVAGRLCLALPVTQFAHEGGEIRGFRPSGLLGVLDRGGEPSAAVRLAGPTVLAD